MAEKNNIKFIRTVSYDKFLEEKNIKKIDIINKKKPKEGTSPFFFSSPDDSNYKGFVAKNIDFEKDVQVSMCINTDENAEFKRFELMHNRNTDNVHLTLSID